MKRSEQMRQFPWDRYCDMVIARTDNVGSDVRGCVEEHRANWAAKRDWAAEEMRGALEMWEFATRRAARRNIVTWKTRYAQALVFEIAQQHGLTEAQQRDIATWMFGTTKIHVRQAQRDRRDGLL